MYYLARIAPKKNPQRFWFAILTTAVICLVLTAVVILLFGGYGVALFILIPFFVGFHPIQVYHHGRDSSYQKAMGMALVTLLLLAICVIIFALEGLICLLMASPFIIPVTMAGASLSLLIINKRIKSQALIWLLLLTIPTTAYVEKDSKPGLCQVSTAIVIHAPIDTVWKNVVVFPELKKPTELIFSVGIAYPINASISGTGIGAIRKCNFTTGSFIEPITTWNAPNLLAFDVLEQPAPLKEISFYDLDAPHLHDYFVSKKGQFKLKRLADNRTLLEGTTWYYHNIRPAIYWKIWSDYIIHQIHLRVLKHIKLNSEKAS